MTAIPYNDKLVMQYWNTGEVKTELDEVVLDINKQHDVHVITSWAGHVIFVYFNIDDALAALATFDEPEHYHVHSAKLAPLRDLVYRENPDVFGSRAERSILFKDEG